MLGVVLTFTMTAESSASTDVGTFLSRCKPLQDIGGGERKASALDEKNLFWCAGHVHGILDGFRIGVQIKGDMKFAKSVSVCPPEKATDVGTVFAELNELKAAAYERSPSTVKAML
jgi:hypothetical protein